MKYCVHCGNQLDDNANICPKCGSSVNDNVNPFNSHGFQNDGSTNSQSAFNQGTAYKPNQPVNNSSGTAAGLTLGILSVVFGALGGFVGLILGIIGVCLSKTKRDRILNIVGMSLFGLWIIILIIVAVSART